MVEKKEEDEEEAGDGKGEKESSPRIPVLEKYDKYSDPLNVRPIGIPPSDGGDGNGLAPTRNRVGTE